MPQYTMPTIAAGASYRGSLTWLNPDSTPVNLTNCNALMDVRDVAGNLLIQLSTVNGRLIITQIAGVIAWNITPADTAGLSFRNAQYDLLVTFPNGDITPLIRGTISAEPVISHV